MISYKEIVSIDIDKSITEVKDAFRNVAQKVVINGNEILIDRHNSYLHLLAPTGQIDIVLKESSDTATHLACSIKPSIFTVRSALGFIILSVVAWSLIFWFFPLNVYMAVAFVLHWIVMCFVALYLLVGFMAILTILLLIYNFSDFPFVYVLVAWLVTLLITHLTLRYNRATLKQYLLAVVNKINLTK